MVQWNREIGSSKHRGGVVIFDEGGYASSGAGELVRDAPETEEKAVVTLPPPAGVYTRPEAAEEPDAIVEESAPKGADGLPRFGFDPDPAPGPAGYDLDDLLASALAGDPNPAEAGLAFTGTPLPMVADPAAEGTVSSVTLVLTATATATETATETEPGWYPVDDDPARRRYWDGAAWTGTTRWDGSAWVTG